MYFPLLCLILQMFSQTINNNTSIWCIVLIDPGLEHAPYQWKCSLTNKFLSRISLECERRIALLFGGNQEVVDDA